MFAPRYFGVRNFGPRYFAPGVTQDVPKRKVRYASGGVAYPYGLKKRKPDQLALLLALAGEYTSIETPTRTMSAEQRRRALAILLSGA